MKTNHMKLAQLLLSCLVFLAAHHHVQAATQPSVSVKSFAQHVGNNTVYNYRVTNLGTTPLTEISIGCNCPSDFTDNSPDEKPQLVIYPLDYVFAPKGRTSAGSYSAPAGWTGLVAHHDETGYISFEFSTPYLSDISLLPGQTGNFSITTPTEDKRGYFIGSFVMSAKGGAYYYEKNRRGYLTGHYTYYDEDIDGKRKILSYPMQLIDQTPPVLTVILTPNILKPSHEKSIPITAVIITKDDYDPQPEIKLESITANEALDKEDIKGAQLGTDDRQFMLKAEREGKNKAGRIYTVTYSATDASGNKATASATVTVPHDEREHEGRDRDENRKKNGKD